MALSGSVFEIWHVTDRQDKQTDGQTDRHPHRFMIWPHIVGHIISNRSLTQTFPADVIYGQPLELDITWPYHVTSSALSIIGPSLLQVRRSVTRYTGQYSWPVAHQQQFQTIIAEDEYVSSLPLSTQRSRDASWLRYSAESWSISTAYYCVLLLCIIDTDIDIDIDTRVKRLAVIQEEIW